MSSASKDPRNPNPPPPPPPGASSSAPAPAGANYFPLPFHLQQQQQQPAPAPMPSSYQYQQYQQLQQAQQLFQRDAQTITPEALESVKAALATSDVLDPANARATATSSDPAAKKKAIPRRAAGQSWEDPTLTDWPDNDYRLFCGDLGNEVNDDVLSKAFSRFPSFNMARVVRDKRTGKSKGYGFVSFSNPTDLAAAIKEMNGKYVGNRPIKLRKSNWKERTDVEALERQKCCFGMTGLPKTTGASHSCGRSQGAGMGIIRLLLSVRRVTLLLSNVPSDDKLMVTLLDYLREL